MIHDVLARYLVENGPGYNRCLLDIKIDSTFVTKGLVFDLEKGNFLKLDARKNVIAASHAFTALSAQVDI